MYRCNFHTNGSKSHPIESETVTSLGLSSRGSSHVLMTKGGYYTLRQVKSEFKSILAHNHPEMKNLKITTMNKEQQKATWPYSNTEIPFVNRWTVKTYPTGLKKKQIYLIVEADEYAATIFDVSQESNRRTYYRSMGRVIQ